MTTKHLTQIEVARRWRLSSRTLEGWRSQGRGPRYLKIGRHVVYRLEDIEAYETEQLRKRPSSPAHAAFGVTQ